MLSNLPLSVQECGGRWFMGQRLTVGTWAAVRCVCEDWTSLRRSEEARSWWAPPRMPGLKKHMERGHSVTQNAPWPQVSEEKNVQNIKMNAGPCVVVTLNPSLNCTLMLYVPFLCVEWLCAKRLNMQMHTGQTIIKVELWPTTCRNQPRKSACDSPSQTCRKSDHYL